MFDDLVVFNKQDSEPINPSVQHPDPTLSLEMSLIKQGYKSGLKMENFPAAWFVQVQVLLASIRLIGVHRFGSDSRQQRGFLFFFFLFLQMFLKFGGNDYAHDASINTET